jgi:hypothetical protein
MSFVLNDDAFKFLGFWYPPEEENKKDFISLAYLCHSWMVHVSWLKVPGIIRQELLPHSDLPHV